MKRELGIARCGLACCLCSENVTCGGCDSGDCPDKDGCENRACSMERGLSHCFACEEGCRKGLLGKIKPYGFTLFARRYGAEELLDCLERNEQKGVVYHREGIWGDYDQFDDVEELLRFIKTGESGKDKEALKKMTHLEQMVGELLDQAKVCFIAYLDDEGYPVTKAMLQPRERNNLGEIWFSTNTSSQKVRAFRENPKASVHFVDLEQFKGVSLVGTVEVLETPEAKERLWRQGDQLYYKQGVNDPDYCVLRFNAVKGRYYHNFQSEDFEVRD